MTLQNKSGKTPCPHKDIKENTPLSARQKTNSLDFEREMLQKGYINIAGMDEVGRGCLAGPVCAAIVILPLAESDIIEGVKDSKALSKKAREELYEIITAKAIFYAVVFKDNDFVDKVNIYNATKEAMQECVKLAETADCVLVDAVKLTNCGKNVLSIIKGDQLSYLIAAASIVAKVTRDRLMCQEAKKYPFYGFEKNVGYCTKEHVNALKEKGMCPLHRQSFMKKVL